MKNVVVLGGGPAGYVAAIRAVQLGAEVTLVEAEKLGGTCLNRGCIPTKALIFSAKTFESIKKGQQEGIILPGALGIDFNRVMERKFAVVNRLVKGLQQLLTRQRIKVMEGRGVLGNDRTVEVALKNGDQQFLNPDAIILCTGSEPSFPKDIQPDGEWAVTSTEALSFGEIPGTLAIIGGGVIGVEFAYIYSTMGSKVSIIEVENTLLPQEDQEAGKVLATSLTRAGVNIHLSTRVIGMDRESRQVMIADVSGARKSLDAAKVLVATGRRPHLSGLSDGMKSLLCSQGSIKVNSFLETSIPNVWAAGDVTGVCQLAHAAFEQGEIAAENAVLCVRKAVDLTSVSRCVYTSPEIASVGMSEVRARELYNDVIIGRFPMLANGKALADDAGEGFVKIIASRKHGQVLGVVMVGSHVSEIIGQAGLSLQLEATLDELANVVAPHPTVSETLKEAALNALGRAIHI
ncbi:dihydrolipoyl dehydrogenase [bacterium]|nr:MAG: dihydrolipoyl dehydrogenase [bacterium]